MTEPTPTPGASKAEGHKQAQGENDPLAQQLKSDLEAKFATKAAEAEGKKAAKEELMVSAAGDPRHPRLSSYRGTPAYFRHYRRLRRSSRLRPQSSIARVKSLALSWRQSKWWTSGKAQAFRYAMLCFALQHPRLLIQWLAVSPDIASFTLTSLFAACEQN